MPLSKIIQQARSYMERVGLGGKLLFIFILMGSIPLIVSSLIAASRAGDAIRTLAFNQLTAVLEVKKSQLENYFRKAENDMKVLVKNPSTHNAMDSFAAMFFAEGEKVDGPMWLATVEELGPSFSEYIRDSGYQDLLLVTMDGRVIYAVGGGSEQGKSLNSGPLAETSLAKAYRKSLLGGIAFADFERFGSGDEPPAAFIAGVLEKYDEPIGVAILQLPRSGINDIMLQRAGMGETGETYLVGEDGLLRSDSLHDKPTSGTGAVNKVSSEPVSAALAGKSSKEITTNYRGESVLSAYSPIRIFDYRWALVSEIATGEAFASIDSFWLLMALVAGLVIVIVAIAAIMLAKSITRPMGKAVWLAERIRSGDLSQRLDSPGGDEIGQLSEALNVMADDISTKITALNQLNRDIHESELKYRNLFEDSLDAITVTDIEGNIQDINDAGLQLLDIPRKEAQGTNLSLMYITQVDRDEFVRQTREHGMVRGFETRMVKKDGKEIEVLLNSTLKKNAQGEAVSLETIIHDISERNKAQRALKAAHDDLEKRVEERTSELFDAKEAAEAANKAKSAFLASMSHELRTPLHAILGYSQIMARSSALPPELKRSIKAINTSGEHLLSLINSVLEMSKIEAGRLTLDIAPFDVDDLLEDLAAMFTERARDKGIDLSLKREPGSLGSLEADLGKLRQVLINLLGNAIKYTDSGAISLTAETQQGDHEDLRLLITVRDTGTGLPDGDASTLFEAFEQGDEFDTRGGTGLGLSISRQYARLMNGDLTARNRTAGKGSVFQLSIEVKEVATRAGQAEKSARKAIGIEEKAAGTKILVVDDVDSNRDVLLQTLASADFVIREADNGSTAVEIFSAWRPDLILMDIRMPGMTGLEAIRAIREIEGASHPKIITFSASAFEEDRRKAMVNGADDFLPKPITESELWSGIGRNLGLELRYEDEEAIASPGLNRDEVALLPPELVQRFARAISDGDLDEAMQLTESIDDDHAFLKAGIQALIDGYDMRTLTQLFPMRAL